MKRALATAPALFIAARAAWRAARAVGHGLFAMAYRPFTTVRALRLLVFDTAAPGTLLLSCVSSERYIVSSNDKSIGKLTFADGTFDFHKFERAVACLGEGRHNRLLVDVGANIGTICIPAVRRGIFERAIAIEPEPFNFSLLSANIHLNGLSARIDTRHMALGQHDAQVLEFELSEENFGDHRIRLKGESGRYGETGRTVISVNSESFDSSVPIERPDETLIWMDTQGFEGFILAGARRALQAGVPLVIEFWPYGMARADSYAILKDALTAAPYQTMRDLSAPDRVMPLNAQTLDALYRELDDAGGYTDLLIV